MVLVRNGNSAYNLHAVTISMKEKFFFLLKKRQWNGESTVRQNEEQTLWR